jgi:hypothetical protein
VILAAGLLVLAGLGLFVAGILTGVTVLYWGCVAACVVAAVLLIAARRQMSRRTTPTRTESTAVANEAATPKAPPTETAPAEEPVAVAAQAPSEEPAGDLPDPEVEEVEVTDLLMVVDLKDEVLVVDEHPRYHVAGCRWVGKRETIPLPIDEARTDGFTPCAVCTPDRTLAERARAKKHAGS